MKVYTDEEKKFFSEYIPGHSIKDIVKTFSEKFNHEITKQQVITYIRHHNISTGRSGKFQKGHIPPTTKPTGSERVLKASGYVQVKVSENNKSKWINKHRAIYEAAYGKIPKGYMIIFKDNNKRNFDLNNLMLISKGENAVLNKSGLGKSSGHAKEAALSLIRLRKAIKNARKENS